MSIYPPVLLAVKFAVPSFFEAFVAINLIILLAFAVAELVTIKMSFSFPVPVLPPKSFTESVPESTLKVSFPAPPVRLSLSSPPVMLSSPKPPDRVSAPAAPVIISFPLPPVN